MDLQIDKEFAEKIPPLTEEEFNQLEANILADGRVINPLIIWNGVIVDGHNRFRILQAHPEIPFQTFEKEFSDRYEVIAWICKNQLGRRNLTPAQRKYLIGKQYEAEKASRGGIREMSRDESGHFTASYQNDNLPSNEKTCDKIARENGLGSATVIRAEAYATGIDAAEEVLPGIKQEILSGSIHPADKDVMAISRASPENRKALAEQLRVPHPSPAKEPERDDDDDAEDEESTEVFKPSIASIRAISEQMASDSNQPKAKVDTEFIILELEDALGSMMFRWDTCLRDYNKEASARDCQKKIKALVQEGIQYLQQFKGGLRNEDK